MAQVSDVINVQVSATSPGLTRQGYGVLNILSCNATFPERTRSYTDISGVGADIDPAFPEYKAAAIMFSQSPRPERVVIGRLALKPTQKFTLTPIAVNDATYSVRVGDEVASYTADGSATVAEIVGGLKSALEAFSLDFTITTNTNTQVIITANTAGDWFDVEVTSDIANMSMAQNHADPGVATDLAAILLADSTWYAIYNPWNSAAMITAIAAWTEANGRLFVAASVDSAIVTHALSGATDIAATENTLAHKRTSVWYHPASGGMLDAGILGRCLPLTPGSENWALKTIVGVTPPSLTATQRANAIAKKANVYERISGRNVTNKGTVADGEYIDVIRFVDWLVSTIADDVFEEVANSDKVPMTDRGIAQVDGAVTNACQKGVQAGGLVKGTVVVTVPKAKDISSEDRANRNLPDVNFTAELAGAFNTARVTGSVSI